MLKAVTDSAKATVGDRNPNTSPLMSPFLSPLSRFNPGAKKPWRSEVRLRRRPLGVCRVAVDTCRTCVVVPPCAGASGEL
jgi:hypothetical protein